MASRSGGATSTTTTLQLYDDRSGLPIELMDYGRIGSLRTPAVSALLTRECAMPASRSARLIGTGTQGRQALPFLLVTMPGLERLMLSGSHPEELDAIRTAGALMVAAGGFAALLLAARRQRSTEQTLEH